MISALGLVGNIKPLQPTSGAVAPIGMVVLGDRRSRLSGNALRL
jgi:hypothetical protein